MVSFAIGSGAGRMIGFEVALARRYDSRQGWKLRWRAMQTRFRPHGGDVTEIPGGNNAARL